MSYNKNGVILSETSDVVVLAVGLKASSSNRKTGGMVQVYILRRDMSPLDAVRAGADVSVCGDCQHRATWRVNRNGERVLRRRCYVDLGKGAAGVWACYHRGGYRRAEAHELGDIFRGRTVRFGAYGDPYYMPWHLIPAIAAHAARWTGYTHQWRNVGATALSGYLMASVDSEAEALEARRMGWRTFRVAPKGDSTRLEREISCPASAEAGKRTTCDRCGLCNGRRGDDGRAHIVIQDHSVIAKTTPLIQIAAAVA